MRINYRLRSGYATVISWHPLMFVAISKSEKTINDIMLINKGYEEKSASKGNSLNLIGDQASAAR